MWASQEGHVEVVDRLIEHGARVDLQNEVKVFQIYSMNFCVHILDMHNLMAVIHTLSGHCFLHLSLSWLSQYTTCT